MRLSVTQKKVIMTIHKWLGFSTGALVFIICITGCIYVFHDELSNATQPWRSVRIENRAEAAPSFLQAQALKVNPQAQVLQVRYMPPGKAAIVITRLNGTFHNLFFNPYSGQFLYDQNLKDDFFSTIKSLHRFLLLPPNIGRPIVGTGVILFFIILLTGLLLWIPRRNKVYTTRFTINFRADWKHINFDLHKILGLYISAVLLISCVTGLAISFPWMKKALYNTANLGKAYPAEQQKFYTDTLAPARPGALDAAYRQVLRREPHAQMIHIRLGEKAGTPLSIHTFYKAPRLYKQNIHLFDSRSGKLLSFQPYQSHSPGKKLNNINYDIHTGQVFGIWGKLILFIASLLCSTLPVTGFFIWRHKRQRDRELDKRLG